MDATKALTSGSGSAFRHASNTAAHVVDFGAFDALTFDCYGTLIDWETGLLAGLRAVLDPHGVSAGDDGAPSSKRASQSTVV